MNDGRRWGGPDDDKASPDKGMSDRDGDEDPGSGSSYKQRAQHMAQLSRTIEGEIIPRLMLAHRGTAPLTVAERRHSAYPSSEEIAEFARIVIEHDVEVACAYVDVLRERGVSVEVVHLELLAPVARLLGAWWDDDQVTFTEVTLGLSRLQQVLHEFGLAFAGELQAPDSGRRALLAPTPGDQHTLGLIMVGEFLRRAGWDISCECASSKEQLMQCVRDESYTMVGLSLSCASRLESLGNAIRSIRRASRNRQLAVMVGGAPFIGHPERIAQVGADAMAVDGRQAVIRAEEMLESLTGR